MSERGGGGSFRCNLCPKIFSKRKELFHHMSSALHRCQSVRCPWCKKMNILTRVGDLVRHCDSVHFREYSLMPDGFLSVPNCFYLSVQPKEYARMTKIEKYDSTIAIEARRVVVNLLDSIKAGDKLRNEIREGWRAGLEIAGEIEKKEKEIKHKKETSVIAAKKDKKRKNIKENETPAKKSKHKETLEETKAVYEKMFKTDPINLKSNKESNDTPPMSEVEFESMDRIKESKVILTKLDGNGVRRLMVKGDENGEIEKHKVKRDSEICKSDQVTVVTEEGASENIKMDQEDKVTDEDIKPITVLENQCELDSKETFIAEKLIESVMYEKHEEVVTDEYVKNEIGKETDEIGMMYGAEINEQVNLGNMISMDVVSEEVVKGVDEARDNKKSIDTKNEKNINDLPEGELKFVNEYLASETKERVPKHTEKKRANQKDNKYRTKITKSYKERISNIEGGEVVVNEKGDSVKIEKGEDNIWRKVKDINNNSVSDKKLRDVELKDSDKLIEKRKDNEKEILYSQSYKPEAEQSNDNQYKETALRILKKGAMPMCPPARRQWGPETLEEIDIGNGQVVQWPPKGWLNMTPDKRLLTVEMMAMTLEAFVNGEVVPEMSRCYLLDKYKFLMLPGALVYHKEKGEDTVTRARYQNFKFLKEVVAGKKLSFAEIQHLMALESISISQSLPLDPSYFTTPIELQKGPSYLD